MNRIEMISALTLAVSNMRRSVEFYQALGFELKYGGTEASFSSFYVGEGFLNLFIQEVPPISAHWGRVIFHVTDVDAQYNRIIEAGLHPEFEPNNAVWGERYFHIRDPDGHELSFARPLAPTTD